MGKNEYKCDIIQMYHQQIQTLETCPTAHVCRRRLDWIE